MSTQIILWATEKYNNNSSVVTECCVYEFVVYVCCIDGSLAVG